MQFPEIDFRYNAHAATIQSPIPLTRIDVVNAIGSCLYSKPLSCEQKTSINLDSLGRGFLVFVCYTADGGMISRSLVR